MMERTRLVGFGLTVAFAVASVAPAAAQSAQPARASYTTAQADSGGASFQQLCSACHGEDLSGTVGPPLKGAPFAYNWDGKFASQLVSYIKLNEPRPNLGTLDDATIVRVIAYMLSMNGVPAGTEPFSGAGRAVIVLPGPRLR
jgi:mono/diheme cytochrome c family protein